MLCILSKEDVELNLIAWYTINVVGLATTVKTKGKG